jgi:hypothetical protein
MNINDNNFQKTAIEGIMERNIISDLFLSKKNIDLIELKIVNIILEKFNYKISKQSRNELLIVMRSIFLDNCTNNYSNKEDVKKELSKLNNLVINYCVDNIMKNIKGHELYLKKINNNLSPLENGVNTNSKGEKQLELQPFF